jgi:hypothetical protein
MAEVMERTLVKVHQNKLDNFEKLFSEVVETLQQVLKRFKFDGIEIDSFQQLEAYCESEKCDPHKPVKTDLEKAIWNFLGLSWKLKHMRAEFFDVKNSQLIIDEDFVERFKDDTFRVYADSDSYLEKKAAAYNLCNALNAGLKHWPMPLSWIDLPLCFAFDGRRYSVREEHLISVKLKNLNE